MTLKRYKFRPSQAGYWSKCAAFMRLTEHFVEQIPGDPAREGTCAAWVADLVLTGDATSCDDLIGKTHANGWLVTEEMAADIQEYVDKMISLGGTILAEEFVTASEDPLIAGTLDTSNVQVVDGILRIVDLKYGRRIVETTAPQLVCYAWGKLISMPPGTVTEIHLSIYQPRSFHRDGIYRTRVITPAELHVEFLKLWDMANEGQKPDSLATPGPHCGDCEAATGCEALARTTDQIVHTVQSRVHHEMTPVELARELDFGGWAMKTVTARVKAVEAEAAARAKREFIPGYSFTQTKGNRVFSVPAMTVQLMTGIDPHEKTLCTPAELGRRGATKAQLALLTRQPVTGHKLTKVTTKPEDIAEMFGDNATKGT